MRVPLSRPDMGRAEESLVQRTLRSGHLLRKPMIPVFEQRFRDYVGVRPALTIDRHGLSIDRDGSMQGYDLELVRSVSGAVQIPVLALGGAGTVQHLMEAVKKGGASAAVARSMFVFHGPHRAVLISYPTPGELDSALGAQSP